MAEILHETETTSDSTVPREEQDNSASMEQYLRNKNLLLDFLRYDLNPHYLQYHWNKIHLLKKCYFYLKFEPRHVCVRDQNNMIFADILQIANPCQLQKIKKLGKNQTEIQLTLLTELLEQLEQGREELTRYVQTCDVETFLSQWDLNMKRVLKLSMLFNELISLEEPRKLHVKHSLVSEIHLGGAQHPPISFSLYAKKPPIFDRMESFACQTWAQLKWFTESQESHLERWQLEIKLVTDDSQTELGYGWTQEVISNLCVINHLLPGRLYEFKVRRSDTHMLVYSQWHDCIILKTKTHPAEDTKEAPSCSLMRRLLRPTPPVLWFNEEDD
ncbi:fibronectin type III domain-containing protein 11 [Chamaea fasciata]|uniref:fibronectin type III domain-containing protein 11 n=1 Tax=Chamaea fasciata TaxID=190680 RepID=UPI00336ADD48